MLQEGDKEYLARSMLACGAVKYGDFTLKSGAKSDVYVDCRRLLTTRQLALHAGYCVARRIAELRLQQHVPVDFLVAVPEGGLPLLAATLMNGVTGSTGAILSGGWVRSKPKDHGLSDVLVGAFPDLENRDRPLDVVMIEDVVTTGGSVLAAMETLCQKNVAVRAVVSLLDRRPDPAVNPFDVPYVAVLTMAELRQLTQ